MLEGRVRRHAHDLQGAAGKFAEAHAIMGVPTTGLELARAQADLGTLVAARRTLREVLLFPSRDGEPEAFKKARKEAEELDSQLSTRVARLKIICQAYEPCRISVDGQPELTTSQEVSVEVDPGRHQVVVSGCGKVEKPELDVTEGQQGEYRFVVPPPAPPPVVPPRSTVRPVAIQPIEPRSSQSGVVQPLSVAALALGTAGLVVGTVTGLQARSKVQQLRANCTDFACPTSESDHLRSADRLATASTVSFIIGGTAAAAGIVGLAWSAATRPAPGSAITIQPLLSWNRVGARVDF